MGNSSMVHSDVFSALNNQAGLCSVTTPCAAAFFTNSFFLPSLNLSSLVFAIPSNYGVFGTSISRYGYEKYNETLAGLSYAKSLGNRFSFGMQFDFLQTHISEGYGNRSKITFEAGIQMQPYKNFILGVHVFNPARVKFNSQYDERIATVMKFGLGWKWKDKCLVTTEVEKDIDYETLFRAGLEYQIVSGLYLRMGIASNPAQSTFGIGYNFKNLIVDIAVASHPTLPLSSQISMRYSFNKPIK